MTVYFGAKKAGKNSKIIVRIVEKILTIYRGGGVK